MKLDMTMLEQKHTLKNKLRMENGKWRIIIINSQFSILN